MKGRREGRGGERMKISVDGKGEGRWEGAREVRDEERGSVR